MTRRGRRGFAGQAAVSVVGAVSLLGVGLAGLFGEGATSLSVPLRDGMAWVQSLATGSLERVDSGSGSVGYRLTTPVAGRPLEIVDDGTTTVLRDPGTGDLRSIDLSGAKAKLNGPVQLAREARLVSGAGHTFVLLAERGEVAALDPATLALGEAVNLGGPLGAAAVDGGGTLWVAVPSLGVVVPVTAGAGGVKLGQRAEVGGAVEVTVSAGLAYGLDRTAGTLLRLRPGQVIEVGRVPAQSVVAAAQGDPADGHVVVGDPSGAVLRIDPATGAVTRFELGDRDGHQLGPPVQGRNRIAVADLTTGELIVIDPASGTLELPLLQTAPEDRGRGRNPAGGQVSVKAADGAVVANDPASSTAVVVTPTGEAEVVDKEGDAPGHDEAEDEKPTPGPSPVTIPTPAPLPGPVVLGPAPAGAPAPGPTGPVALAPTGPAAPPAAGRPSVPPTAVGSLKAIPGDGTIDLTWSAAQNGGSPLLGHRVECSGPAAARAAVDAPGGATTTTVRDLRNGVEYRCTVVARNAVGSGPVATSPPVRPLDDIPGAPTAVQAMRGDKTLVVRWSAPTTGGAPVAKYVATAGTPTGSVTVEVAGGLTTGTIAGLVNGTPYQVSVRAFAATGVAGPAGSAPAPVSPAGPPGSPQAMTVNPLSRAVEVGWRAAAPNGSPVTGYTVRAEPGGHRRDVPPGATSASLNGLVNGTKYTVTVNATNAVGTGAASSKAATPGAPEIGPVSVVLVRDTTFEIKFAVDWNGETPGECSVKFVDQPGFSSTNTAAKCTFSITGRWGTRYVFSAVAVYAEGEVERGPVEFTTPPAPRVYLTRSMQYEPRDWFYGRPEEGTPFELVQESDIWVYTDLMPGTVKLLRWSDGRPDVHCYGTSDEGPQGPGFTSELLGYIYPKGDPSKGGATIRRYVRADFQGPGQGRDCFLPASAPQYAELGPGNWTDQGVIGHSVPPP